MSVCFDVLTHFIKKKSFSTCLGYKSDRTASIDTDSTAIWSDEDGEEAVDKLSNSGSKPVTARVRRTRLKRAQSERVPSLDGTPPPPLPPRGPAKNPTVQNGTRDEENQPSSKTGTPKVKLFCEF